MKNCIFINLLILTAFFSLNSSSLSSNEQKNEQTPNSAIRNSSEVDFFADLIVWTAKEAGSDCWSEVITYDNLSSNNELRQVDFGWNFGFRVGASYNIKNDKWDTRACYTWFKTRGNDQVSSEPGAVHSTFLGNFYLDNPTGKGISGPSYQHASIDWSIHFNMFDWDLRRMFLVSKSLSLSAFLGIKGGWIYQSIHSRWENPALPKSEYFNAGIEQLENNFWGIGPQFGINIKVNLYSSSCQLFHLLGDFSGAMMYGHWSFKDIFNNDKDQKISVNLSHLNSGACLIRTFMGFGWNVYFSQNHQFSTKLGYEMQFCLDQLQFYSFTGGRLSNELTLQGGTIAFCFDF